MEGYAKIAKFMGRHSEAAQVLRFSDINLQNILYLQAEIFGLREDLRNVETENEESSSPDLKKSSVDWYMLAKLQDSDSSPTNRQWEKVLDMLVHIELIQDYV